MPKSIDDIDIRIIDLLVADGRVTNRALAKTVGLSESACLARLRNLERQGVITGYGVTLSFEQLGVFETWVDVTLVDDETLTVTAFERLLPKEREICAAYLIGEDAKFRLHVVTANFERWRAFARRILSHRAIVKGVTRSVIYKRYRIRGCAVRQILGSQPSDGGSP